MTTPLKLLQVEDSESDGALIVRHLEQAGYRVESSRVDDEPGLRAALKNAAWDLVICDYRMPTFDAPSALAVMRESGLDIPFLVVSGTIGEDLAVAMMKAGAHDYLMKNNLTRLGAAVERELREAKSRAERRQAIESLREREAQLSMAIESTELGIFDCKPASGRIFFSPLARKHLRMADGPDSSLEEFLEMLHDDDRSRIRAAFERALQPGSDGHYSEEYRLNEEPSGTEIWISAWGRVSRDESGAATRFLGVMRDITERKRAERDLQFQLQLTACITEQSADCIMLTDLAGNTRFVNPEAERVFGYSFSEFQAKPIHELLRGGDLRLSIETQVTKEREKVFFHRDGTPIDVAVSSTPLVLNGAQVGVVVTARDIRERRRAEQELRRSDARFRRLFDAGIIGFLIVDGDYVVEANDHFLDLTGYSREDLTARRLTWRDLNQPDQLKACEETLRTILSSGACPPVEKNYLRKDGTQFPALFAGVELNPGVDTQLLGFVVDLTERKSLESQVRQSQKLESIGLLAGGVAHDFNNLLTVIMGYADIVHAGMDEESRFRSAVEQISGAANRAAGLTRQLLTFSRRNAGEPRTVVLNELVKGVEGMVRRLIGEDIEIVFTSERGQQLIHADPGLIEQVIMNLVVNARDAMPNGGRLYVETSRMTVTESFLSPMMVGQPGEYVSLAVTDTGTGMTPEVQARLFEPFFTTKEPGKGTGLGLSTVYGIVKQSGGSITVHSTPGIGTSFRVLFPAVGTEPTVRETARTEAPGPGTETILLVEDESGVRNYLRDILQENGYRALDMAHPSDALEMAAHFEGKIDLMLTDVVLPSMNGNELIERFRAIRPEAKVLRMSGYPDRFDVQTDEEVPHLEKPFTAEVLLRRLREVLDGEG